MGARWDIAAAIIALLAIFAQVLSASPAAAAFFRGTFRKLVTIAQPQKGRCRRLRWEDIPDGRLHQCNPPALCAHDLPLNSSGQSGDNWEDTIGQIFTRMWTKMEACPKDSRYEMSKPLSLALQEDYIQMDIKALKAYLVLTIELCHTSESDEVSEVLGTEHRDNLVVLHLKALHPVPKNFSLTKLEVDRFIEGYPPFYREFFTTTGGVRLDHPVTAASQLGRGAWILAVGMSDTLGPICAIHNMQLVVESRPSPFWKGTLVMTAFRDIQRTLGLINQYERDQSTNRQMQGEWSLRALLCYDIIMSEGYSLLPWPLKVQTIENSDLFSSIVGACPCQNVCMGSQPHSPTCGRNQHEKKTPASTLNEIECRSALEIFSNYQLSDQNLAIILPRLEEILQSLILGMLEVEHYFAYVGRKLELPKDLTDKKVVYARQSLLVDS